MSICETAARLRFSDTTETSVFTQDGAQHRKHPAGSVDSHTPVDERGQRRMAMPVRADRKATVRRITTL